MIRPVHTLRFLICVLALLAVLMLVFPNGGIRITDDLSLYFPSLSEWWKGSDNNATNSTAYIPDLVEEDQSGRDKGPDTGEMKTDSIASSGPSEFDSSVYSFVPRPIQVDQIRQPLELPASGLGCLENLFASLVDPEELGKVIHIVHYGDSQIEADRITNYLRYKLQQQFGGSGPGLVPARTAYDYKAPCAMENVGDWKRYTVFPRIDTAVKHSRYGVLAAFSRFSPLREEPQEEVSAPMDSLSMMDTILNFPSLESFKPVVPVEEPVYSGTLNFVPATFGHANVREYRRLRMLYGNNSRKFSVSVRDGDEVLYQDSMPQVSQYAVKSWVFGSTPSQLSMDFSGADSPDIYGFALDGLSGVAVDNVPLRGCSGTIFTKINGSTLAQMYRDLNVRCIILQFGGNAVPSINVGEAGTFRNYISSQIRYLRRIYPGVSIILIGPADMSRKVEGTDRFETYEVLPEVVQGLRKAAFDNDCAYWDMYSAMGGWNTMPDWVAHDPAYGEKDYVHFTGHGANVMARMFYSALIARYNEYISNK